MPAQYSSVETTIAVEAEDYYNQSQFASCLTHMKKLHSMRPTDPKVLANKALIEFIYQKKLTCSDEYLAQLQKAATLAGSPLLVTGSSDVRVAVRPVGPTAEPSVISMHYNYALVLFHQRQYVWAERMLASLLGIITADAPPSSIEFPLGAGALLSQRCFLLWMDLCFCLQRPRRVFEFASYWLQQLNSGDESVRKPVEVEVLDMLRAIARPLRVFHFRACLMTGQIKIAQEAASQLSQSDDDLGNKSWDTSKSLDYACAQLSYLEQDHTKTVKRLNALLPTASTSSSISVDQELPLVWNNLSLTYFRAGYLGLAMLEARAALRHTKSLADEVTAAATEVGRLVNCTPLYQLGASRHYELLYNTGVQLLLGQKNLETAFSALLAVVKVYPRNPRLWLRLAECCVKVHRPNNLIEWKAESRASCLQRVVGEGAARKLILGTDEGSQKPSRNELTPASEANLSLEFAAQCLRNAAFLLPRPPIDLNASTASSDQLPVDRLRSALLNWATLQAIQVPPSSQPLCGMALLQVISAVLLTSAYVALCLEDPVEAIYYAEQLLSVGPSSPRPVTGTIDNTFVWIGLIAPPAHRYLAKMYLAEARIAMDEVTEASMSLLSKDCVTSVERASALPVHALRSYAFLQRECACLSPAFLLPQTHSLCGLRTDAVANTTTSAGTKSSNSDLQRLIQLHKEQCEVEPLLCQSINPKSPDFPYFVDQAIGVLLYNMAVCFAVRGDLSRSRHLLENAAPSLLVNFLDPGSRAPVRHGSEEHQRLLYPTDATIGGISRLLTTHHLPRQFLLLWLYLEMREDRASSAVNFLRAHIGDVAFNSHFSDMSMRELSADGGMLGEDGISTVMFDDGGVERLEMSTRPLTRPLSMAPLRSASSSRPMPLQIQDPPPSSSSKSAAAPCWTDADWPPLQEW
ncbi:unnamed protein product [Hydatigera taeniaeformis]|uniref:CCR4-NOT transcription complex subunit 10 n=1 Tax=Hydatigena taeniaeformis TaxID=6205 RepID=A0A158RD91_HYDTA|nr:unnamed protein product [Hydatigera taeniaeformis]